MAISPTGKAQKLRKLQVAKQAAWDTFVAATALLGELNDCELTFGVETKTNDHIGDLAPSTGVDVVAFGGTLTIKGVLTFQDSPLYWQAAHGAATPSGAGPYVRTYATPYSSAPTPEVYSFEFGLVGSSQLYKAYNAVLSSLKIEGKHKDYVYFEASFALGRIATLGSFTSLSTRTLTMMRTRDVALSVDAQGGTPGTTAWSGVLYDWMFEVQTGYHMKEFQGSIYAQGYGIDQWSGSFEMTLEDTSTVDTELSAVLDAAPVWKYVQLLNTRSTSSEKLIFSGTIDGSAQKLYDNQNGNAVVKMKFLPQYDATLGYWYQVTNTNSVASLPF